MRKLPISIFANYTSLLVAVGALICLAAPVDVWAKEQAVSVKFEAIEAALPANTENYLLSKVVIENKEKESVYIRDMSLSSSNSTIQENCISKLSLRSGQKTIPLNLSNAQAVVSFSGKGLRVGAGQKITLDLTVDTKSFSNQPVFGLRLDKLSLQSYREESLGQISPRASLSLQPKQGLISLLSFEAYEAPLRTKGVNIASVNIRNGGGQDISLKYLTLHSQSGLGKSSGFNRIKITDQKSGRVLASVSRTEADSIRLSLGSLKIAPGATQSLVLKADTGDTINGNRVLNLDSVQYKLDSGRAIAEQSIAGEARVSLQAPVNVKWTQRPVSGRINYHFNDPDHPYGSGHNGLDFAASQGTAVKAVAAGVVRETYFNGNEYAYVRIEHSSGLSTVYGHLSKIEVKVGDKISAGQRIALSGGKPGTPGAGRQSNGAHLHFEVLKNEINVDPLPYFSR